MIPLSLFPAVVACINGRVRALPDGSDFTHGRAFKGMCITPGGDRAAFFCTEVEVEVGAQVDVKIQAEVEVADEQWQELAIDGCWYCSN